MMREIQIRQKGAGELGGTRSAGKGVAGDHPSATLQHPERADTHAIPRLSATGKLQHIIGDILGGCTTMCSTRSGKAQLRGRKGIRRAWGG